MALSSLANDPDYMAYLGSLENKYGLPTGLLATQQKHESNFNPVAVSSAGAQGIAQFMPATAQQYGIDPLDPMQASEGQARMLSDLARKYNGDIPSVLAAYNWGSGNLDKKGLAAAPQETRSYIQNIMGSMPQQQVASNQNGGALAQVASGIGNAIIPQAQAEEMSNSYNGSGSGQPQSINVKMPDGTIIQNVPPDITQEELQQQYTDHLASTPREHSDVYNMALRPLKALAAGAAGIIPDTLATLSNLSPTSLLTGTSYHPDVTGSALAALNKMIPTDEPTTFGGFLGQEAAKAAGGLMVPIGSTEQAGKVVGQTIERVMPKAAEKIIPQAEEASAKKIIYESSVPMEVSKEQRKALDILPDIVGHLNPEEIASKLEQAKALGQPMTALDAIQSEKGGILSSGKNALGMARALANMPGETADMAGEVAQRAAQAPQRIGSAFDNLVSKNDFYGTLQEAQNAKSSSNPFYQNAFKQNQNMQSPIIDRILKTPAGKQALKETAQELQNRMTLLAKPDPELTEQAREVGLALKNGAASGLKMRTLDLVKQKLDAMASTAFKAANMGNAPKSRGTQFSDLAKGLRKEMDNLDVTAKAGPNSLKPEGGDYAKGRARSAQGFQMEDAAQQGRDFMKSDPEEISAYLKNEDTTMPMKDAYMKGVRRSLQDMVDRIGDNRNPLSTVWKQNIRDKLNAMGFDQKELSNFNKFMENEKTIQRTNSHLSGGSMTNPNANYQDMVSTPGITAKQIAKGIVDTKGALIDYGFSKLDNLLQKRLSGATQKTSKEIMKYLLTDDPKVWRGLKIKGAK